MNSESETLPTNEEIIEELTKDLESSCIKIDKNSKGKDSEKDVKTAGNDSTSANSWEDVREEEELSDRKEKSKTRDAEDEEVLRERDETLNEAEKKDLRDEAEKLKNEGNSLFKEGKYIEAVALYTQGLQTCPLAFSKERAILYSNRAAAKTKCLSEKESIIADCTKAIELNPSYVKAYIRRAQLYEETEKLDEALEDYKKVLTFDPSHTEANYAVRKLPALINERNEKLKTEMLGKLKDLGNMVLKPFGLSTNNFELQKDPNSGGYSVKFHQNPR